MRMHRPWHIQYCMVRPVRTVQPKHQQMPSSPYRMGHKLYTCTSIQSQQLHTSAAFQPHRTSPDRIQQSYVQPAKSNSVPKATPLPQNTHALHEATRWENGNTTPLITVASLQPC